MLLNNMPSEVSWFEISEGGGSYHGATGSGGINTTAVYTRTGDGWTRQYKNGTWGVGPRTRGGSTTTVTEPEHLDGSTPVVGFISDYGGAVMDATLRNEQRLDAECTRALGRAQDAVSRAAAEYGPYYVDRQGVPRPLSRAEADAARSAYIENDPEVVKTAEDYEHTKEQYEKARDFRCTLRAEVKAAMSSLTSED